MESQKNVNKITDDATELVDNSKPEIAKVMGAVGNVSDTVNGIARKVDTTSLKVTNTVNNVSDVVSDTAKTVSLNVDNVIDYFYIFKEIVATLKRCIIEMIIVNI